MPPLEVANNVARRDASVTPLQTSPYNLTGSGVTIMIYDGTLVGDHKDFGNRIIQRDPNPQIEGDDHATLVGGIVGGDGSASNGQFAGMAPAVNISTFTQPPSSAQNFYTFPADLNNDTQRGLSADIDLATMSMAHNVFHKNAGLCRYLGDYSEAAELIDKIVRGEIVGGRPLIFFEAAGNERSPGKCNSTNSPPYPFGTISSPATAKNSISVGAINSAVGTTSTAIGLVSSSSSWGPTDDGRIKPDIVAAACRNDTGGPTSTSRPTSTVNNGYRQGGCATSFATPIASGATALLIEQWKKIQGSNSRPLPHTVKAILIHTAIDGGNEGPDFEYGWGALNAKAAVDLVTENKTIVVNQVDTHESDIIHFTPDGSDKVRVTLVWDDPSATPLSTPTLINNLDLKLEDPTGKIYRPFLLFLDPNNVERLTFGVDTVNNVEMVEGNPIAGIEIGNTWKATITSPNVSTGHQQYTVIVSGMVQQIENLSAGTSGTTTADIAVTSPTVKEGGRTSSKTITFNYTSNISGATFECKLDSEQSFSSCQSSYHNLGEGPHVLEARAVIAGNPDMPTKIFGWTVDLTPPVTQITSRPPNPSGASVSFTFSSNEPGTFECKLDSGSFEKCPSPIKYPPLADQNHTFEVKAIDSAGNADLTPEEYAWTVDATPGGATPAPPNPPTSLTATAVSSSKIILSWTAPPGGGSVTEYKIERRIGTGSFDQLASTTSTTFSDTNVIAGTTHTYKVFATNNIGSSQATEVSATTPPSGGSGGGGSGGGGSGGGGSGGGCLIANAAFGSELAPQVQQLRETRDKVVMQTQSGEAFMIAFNSIYYSFAPSVADWERQNPIFKESVKIIITPLLSTLSILNYIDIDSEEKMLAYGIGIILLNIGMYFVAPVFIIMRFRHK